MKPLALLILLLCLTACALAEKRKVDDGQVAEVLASYSEFIADDHSSVDYFRSLLEKDVNELDSYLFGDEKPAIAKWALSLFFTGTNRSEVEEISKRINVDENDLKRQLVSIIRSSAFIAHARLRIRNALDAEPNRPNRALKHLGNLVLYEELKDFFAPFSPLSRDSTSRLTLYQTTTPITHYPVQAIRTWITREPERLVLQQALIDTPVYNETVRRFLHYIIADLITTGVEKEAISSLLQVALARVSFKDSVRNSQLYKEVRWHFELNVVVKLIQRLVVEKVDGTFGTHYTLESYANAIGQAVRYETVQELYDRVREDYYIAQFATLKRDPRYSLLHVYGPNTDCGGLSTSETDSLFIGH